MEYVFKKNYDTNKKGRVIKTDKPNKLLLELVKKGFVSKKTKKEQK